MVIGFLFFSSCSPNTYADLNPQGLVGLTAMFSAVVTENLEHRASAELAAQLRDQALRDPLTGLLNRRGMEAMLRSEHQAGQMHALVMIDLDGFKRVNDTHGHAAGDQVLRDVAAIITRTIRRGDFAARLGGDEFVIALNDSQGASRISHAIVADIAVLDAGVTASVGLVVYHPQEADHTSLLALADAAMYQAKLAGGGRAVWAESDGLPTRSAS